jgi:hypothetical protein
MHQVKEFFKLKLDEQNPTYAGLTQENGFSSA